MNEELIWQQIDQLRCHGEETSKINIEEQYICACGGTKSYQFELPTCTNCGRVDDSLLSEEAEWICGPEDGENPSRVGIPVDTVLYSEAWGIGTVIRNGQRLSKINLHSNMNHRDRALHHAYSQFDQICKGKLKLMDNTVDYAKLLYRKFNAEKLTRGAVRAGVKANCVLYACNEHGVARTLQEVSAAFGIPVKDISRTSELFGKATGQTQSSDLVSRIFNSITCIPDNDKGRVRMKVIRMCEDIQTNPELMGKTPKGIASAVIFKTLCDLGYPVDKAFIAKICEVSVPTLNKIEKIIRED
jgi:transcription initiation factor TFIIIB Brf1 subunit/transcription initiation factor TFIIB